MDFAGEVSRSLTHGKSHYKIPTFFKELLKDVSTLLDSTQIGDIMSQLTIIHSEKLRQEKGPTKKKSSKKPTLKGVDKKGKVAAGEEEDIIDEFDEYADII